MSSIIENGCFETWDDASTPHGWTPTIPTGAGITSGLSKWGHSDMMAVAGGRHPSQKGVDIAIDELGSAVSLAQTVTLVAEQLYHLFFWHKFGYDDLELQALSAHHPTIMVKAADGNHWLGADGEWKAVETKISLTPLLALSRFSLYFTALTGHTSYTITIESGDMHGQLDDTTVLYEHLYLDNAHCEPIDEDNENA